MGQTYSVYLAIKFKDIDGATQALKDRIARAKDDRVNYSLEHIAELGKDMDCLLDLLTIFYGGWDCELAINQQPNGFVEYSSGFDASYGWEWVMMTAFEDIAPFLENESSLIIYPDSGRDQGIVKNGKVKWIQR